MFVLSRRSRQSVMIGGADVLHRLLKVTVKDPVIFYTNESMRALEKAPSEYVERVKP